MSKLTFFIRTNRFHLTTNPFIYYANCTACLESKSDVFLDNGLRAFYVVRTIVRASFQGHRRVHVSLNAETARILYFKREDFETDPIQIVVGFAPCQSSYDMSKLCEKYKRDSYPFSEKGNSLLKKTNMIVLCSFCLL